MANDIQVTIDENRVDVNVCETPSTDVIVQLPGCNIISESPPVGLNVDLLPILLTGGGSDLDIVLDETPIGLIDGSNTLFTLEFAFSGNRVSPYLNGLKLNQTEYALIPANQFRLNTAPLAGDIITVDYVKRNI